MIQAYQLHKQIEDLASRAEGNSLPEADVLQLTRNVPELAHEELLKLHLSFPSHTSIVSVWPLVLRIRIGFSAELEMRRSRQ